MSSRTVGAKGDAINFLFADGHMRTATLIEDPQPWYGFPEMFGDEYLNNTEKELFY